MYHDGHGLRAGSFPLLIFWFYLLETYCEAFVLKNIAYHGNHQALLLDFHNKRTLKSFISDPFTKWWLLKLMRNIKTYKLNANYHAVMYTVKKVRLCGSVGGLQSKWGGGAGSQAVLGKCLWTLGNVQLPAFLASRLRRMTAELSFVWSLRCIKLSWTHVMCSMIEKVRGKNQKNLTLGLPHQHFVVILKCIFCGSRVHPLSMKILTLSFLSSRVSSV